MLKYILCTLACGLFTATLTAQTPVINEILSSNTQFFDNYNETPDWIEIYNPGPAINLAGYSISDRADSLNQWVFPQYTLDSAATLLLLASGRDVRTLSNYHTLINKGDTCHYAAGSSTIPTNWNQPGFDYSGWATGPSGFGFGDADDATLVATSTVSVFVIKTFNITDISQVTELLLHVDYDDGFVAYLNGTEIARAGMGTAGSAAGYNTFAEAAVEPQMVQNLPPVKFDVSSFMSLLVDGQNTLALSVHNSSATSSDLTLIPFLTAGFSYFSDTFSTPSVLGLGNSTFHTNFKLSAEGEKLFLADATGTIIDQTDSLPLPINVSYGRKPNGTGPFYYFNQPTPGQPNTTKAYTGTAESTVTASLPAGIYKQTIKLTLTNTGGYPIYYTTDGSDPSTSSTLYTQPIGISKPTVIKAMENNPDKLPGTPYTATYIVDSRPFTLPIIALSTNPDNLWNYNTGIYVKGPNASSEVPYNGANFWQDWERPIYVEYFDASGVLQLGQLAGTKIFGGWSRAADQKSMALFARKEYGNNTFDYPFFEEKPQLTSFKSVVLRNSGNDWNESAMRDAALTTLTQGTGIDKQAYQPVVVYLNGEYWGMLNMREKINEDYVENNHGVKAADVDILEGNGTVVEGSNQHYLNMIDYITNNSLANHDHYNKVKEWMDVSNFMEYQIAQIYFNNRDWPGNNIKYWRESGDFGLWRWFLYDTDFGFGIWGESDFSENTLAFALVTNGPSWPNPDWSTFLLRNLLKNSDFKTEFINRFADRLNTNYSSAKVEKVIDSLALRITNEIPYHTNRWNHIWDWPAKIERMITFANERPAYMRGFIRSQFSLAGQYNLSVSINDTTMGYIQLNALSITDPLWTGIYFKGVPVTITAIPKPGYRFKQWVNSNETSTSIRQAFSANTSVQAIFEAGETLYSPVVINEINYNSATGSNMGDWVELYNTNKAKLDIGGWILTDGDSNRFTIPNGTFIAPQGYLVLCQNQGKLRKIHTKSFASIGDFDFGFGSDFEVIKLYNAQKQLVDSVYYETVSPWPSKPNGDGYTLALMDSYTDNSKAYNWEGSVIELGTPGFHNSGQSTAISQYADLAVTAMSLYPNPTNEAFTIDIELNTPMAASITITDVKGMIIETIMLGNLPSGNHRVQYLQKLTPGLYFVTLMHNQTGIKTSKLVVGF